MRKGDYVETVGIGDISTWSKIRGTITRKEGNSISVQWDALNSEGVVSPDEIKLVKRKPLFDEWKKKNKFSRLAFLRKQFDLSQKEARSLYRPNPVFFPFNVKKHFFEL